MKEAYIYRIYKKKNQTIIKKNVYIHTMIPWGQRKSNC